MKFCRNLQNIIPNTDDIEKKHKDAIDKMKLKIFDEYNFTRKITGGDVRKMYEIIDYIFFEKKISKLLIQNQLTLSFGAKNKLKKTAGMCYKRSNTDYEIILSIPIINSLFVKDEKKYKMGGIFCESKVACAHHILCHELVHLINFIDCPELIDTKGGHGKIFQDIVYNIFGHTNCHHCLMMDHDTREKMKENMLEKNTKHVEDIKEKFGDMLKIGNYVYARHQTKLFEGEIISINKSRIKIKTFDNKMWYIPYVMIEKIEKK